MVYRDVKDGRLHLIGEAEPPLYSRIALVRHRSKFVPRPVAEWIATARRMDLGQLRLLTLATARRPPAQ